MILAIYYAPATNVLLHKSNILCIVNRTVGCHDFLLFLIVKSVVDFLNQPKLSCSESVEKKAAFFFACSFALLLIGFFVPSR